MTNSNEIRLEPILVLYGSQTGNSEQAAKEICDQMITKLSPSEIVRLTNSSTVGINANIVVKPMCMQLDDFLEINHCHWTRIFIIVVSSYGVGQAPIGSHRFRELCDTWISNSKNSSNETTTEKLLQGTYFAMCGLGDSKYTTFFRNPTIIHEGLKSVGSVCVGELGKADASGTGINEQSCVIERWKENMWKDIATVLVHQKPISTEILNTMQKETFKLCIQINPDLQNDDNKQSNGIGGFGLSWNQLFIMTTILIIAIASQYLL